MGWRLGVSIAALTLFASAAVAEASKLSGEHQWSTRSPVALAYSYTAAPGERNDLIVTEDPASLLRTTFTDHGALITEFPTVILQTEGVPLPTPAALCVPALRFVTCAELGRAEVVHASVALGDGDDRLRATGPLFGVFVNAGDGDDVVDVGSARHLTDLGPGNDSAMLRANGLADRITCGQGDDTVRLVGALEPHDVVTPDCEQVVPG